MYAEVIFQIILQTVIMKLNFQSVTILRVYLTCVLLLLFPIERRILFCMD